MYTLYKKNKKIHWAIFGMFLLQYRRHNKISQKNVLWHSTYVHIILVDMRKPVLEKKHYICKLVPVADLSKVMEGRWTDHVYFCLYIGIGHSENVAIQCTIRKSITIHNL